MILPFLLFSPVPVHFPEAFLAIQKPGGKSLVPAISACAGLFHASARGYPGPAPCLQKGDVESENHTPHLGDMALFCWQTKWPVSINVYGPVVRCRLSKITRKERCSRSRSAHYLPARGMIAFFAGKTSAARPRWKAQHNDPKFIQRTAGG